MNGLFGAFAVALVVLGGSGCGSRSGLAVASDGGSDTGDAGETSPRCVDAPAEIELRFTVRVRAADLALLVDATGSMSEEIDRLRESFAAAVLLAMRERVPDLQVGVAAFGDFPKGSYGAFGVDDPFVLEQRVTADSSRVAAALDGIGPMNGGDGPESHVEALYQAATGEGLGYFADPGRRVWYVEPAACSGAGRGALCFRRGALPVVALLTDAAFHNAPDGSFAYDPEVLQVRPASYADAAGALDSLGARVVGLYSGAAGGPGERHLRRIARDTGAVSRDGTPLVVDVGRAGERLDDRATDALATLVEQSPWARVELVAADVPGDAVDTTSLIESITASAVTPADAGELDRGAFVDVEPGARLSFNVRLAAPGGRGRYGVDMVLRADGTELARERLSLRSRGVPCD